ncbi:opioid growth factor receptor-related protein [Sphingomonas oleivorans]|nr:opioid growth factor receptor-related protein [Sphingomonas oleivorans]
MTPPFSFPLRAFFDGGTDAAGRTHAEIIGWPDVAIEQHHDFIQWLFPLPEPSRAVPGSPVLTEADRAELAASPAARERMEQAAARMLRFYRDNDHWLVPHDHNHLRISRIIRSLRLILGDSAADRFRDAIMARVAQAGASISATSLDYWSAA